MALTKVGPAGIGSTPGTGYVIGDSFLHSTGLDSTNAKFTGIVTAQTFRVLGNFQVDGTTTTLDTEITSVDKLEVAANNTTVGVAITQSGSGDILNLYDGSTEVFSVADGGSVTITDSIIHSGDENTKIRFPAADTITAETGGTERLRIKSDGKIGVGTNNPTGDLTISKANGSIITLQRDDTSTAGNRTIGEIVFRGNDNSGSFQDCAKIRAISDKGHSDDDKPTNLEFYTTPDNSGTSVERFRITSEGLIGIGTDAPGASLQINSATPKIILQDNDNGADISVASIGGAAVYSAASDTIFQTANTSERLRITAAGNVLIGTTTEGDTAADNLTIADSGESGITIRSGTTSTGNIYFSDATSGSGEYDGYIQYSQNDRHLTLGTAAAERLRVDSNGSLLINGTSTFGSPVKLQVRGASSALSDGGQIFDVATTATATGGTRLAFGVNEDTYSWIRSYESGVGSRDLVFAGVAEYGRFDASGRLLINKTTNRDQYYGGTYTGQLQVEGTNDATRLTQFIHNTNAASQPIVVLGKSRGTSVGSYTVVQNGDYLGTLSFQGADGDEMIEGARIDAIVSAAPGADDMPTALSFGVTADGAAGTTERLRITSAGKVGINQSSPAHQLDVKISDNTTYTPGNFILNGVARLHNESTTTNSFASLVFRTASGDNAIGFVYPGSVNQADFVICNDGGTNGVERFRIAANGAATFTGEDFPYCKATLANKKLIVEEYSSHNSNSGIEIRKKLPNGNVHPAGYWIGDIHFKGWDGDQFIRGGLIECVAEGTPANNSMPAGLRFSTNSGGTGTSERLRITSAGKLLVSGQNALTSTPQSHSLQVAAQNDANAIAIFGRNGDDIGELSYYESDKSTKLGEIQYRPDHVNIRHRVGDIRFATGGTTERVRIRSQGPHLLIGTGGDATYNEITESSSNAGLVIGSGSMGNGGIVIRNSSSGTGRIYFADNSGNDTGRQRGQINYYHTGDYMMFATASTERMRLTNDGMMGLGTATPTNSHGKGLHIADINAGIRIQNTVNTGWAYLEYAEENNTVKFIQGYRDANGLYGIRPGNSLVPNDGLTITDTGRVGVNDSTSGYAEAFQVTSNTDYNQYGIAIKIQSNSGYLMRFANGTTGPCGSVSSSGGNSTAFNTYWSDSRRKKNFETWNEEVLPHFKSLEPKKFNFIHEDDGTVKSKGYAAQDNVDKFPEAYPLLDDTDIDEKRYMFNPSGMVIYLMKALQEEIAKREAIEQRLTDAGL